MSVNRPGAATAEATRSAEIDLSDLSGVVPDGTIVECSVRGTRACWTAEVEHAGLRYVVEGGARSGVLTGVFGGDEPATPERVPDWLVAVLDDVLGVTEVDVHRPRIDSRRDAWYGRATHDERNSQRQEDSPHGRVTIDTTE